MEDISDLVRRVEASLAGAVQKGSALAEAARAAGNQARRLSREAHAEGGRIRSELDRQAYALDEESSRLARQRADAEAVGTLLAELFQQAAQLLDAIAQENAKGHEIERRIQLATAQSEHGKHKLRLDLGRWTETHGRLQAAAIQSDRHIDQMTEQLASFDEIRVRIESVIQELRANGFENLERRLEGTHLEAILADERDRWIRLQLDMKKRAETRAELILDLELVDWDEEDAARFDERLTERVISERRNIREGRPTSKTAERKETSR